MSRKDRTLDRGDAPDDRDHAPRHPSYDPSGDEPAGSSDGLPDRSFAGTKNVEAESEQAPARRDVFRRGPKPASGHDGPGDQS